ncbi:hypothetical protein AMECASPLE_028452 [Ameca splendens]|uniref:Uncharacterized protein n=1 Tax=Ameca splendens TaxID=208324 RepID=A0ABV0YTA3_9TELE
MQHEVSICLASDILESTSAPTLLSHTWHLQVGGYADLNQRLQKSNKYFFFVSHSRTLCKYKLLCVTQFPNCSNYSPCLGSDVDTDIMTHNFFTAKRLVQ